jgi:hypothetical protein
MVELTRAVAGLGLAGGSFGLLLSGAGCTSASPPPAMEPPLDASSQPESGPRTGDLGSPDADAGAPPPPLACPPVTKRFVPSQFVPSIAHQGRCTPADIAAFVSACISPGLTCPEWAQLNHPGYVEGGVGTPCGACFFEPKNNGAAWVDPEDLFIPNLGGCIQILDPVLGPRCAQDIDDLNGCQALACEYCPNFSPNDYNECIKVTGAGACAPYINAAQAACEAASSAYLTCTANAGAASNWVYIANLVCGESGTDAAAD